MNRPELRKAVSLSIAAPLLFWVATSCADPDGGPRKITQTRETVVKPGSVALHATSAERFGGEQFGANDPAGSGHGDGGNDQGGSDGAELLNAVPDGWLELPPTDIRRLNFQPAGSPDAECYLSVLPNSGVTENVNRWRMQFGLPLLDGTAVAALPKSQLLKLDATRVELDGTFTTMDGARKPDFALIGAMATLGDRMLFVKMTGPKALLETERAHFDEFVASLRIGRPGDKDGEDGKGAKEEKKPASGERFTLPPGWTETPGTGMRLATLKPAGTSETECALLEFPGGGGVRDNVDRWRTTQLGLAALTDAEWKALERIEIAGSEGVLVDLRGDYSDSMNARSIPGARFLGLVLPLGEKSLFVKLSGPAIEIDEPVVAAFRALCASIRR